MKTNNIYIHLLFKYTINKGEKKSYKKDLDIILNDIQNFDHLFEIFFKKNLVKVMKERLQLSKFCP